MTELILNDPIALRRCILFEFLDDKPIWESYKKMCSKLGQYCIQYTEFENWFMKFARKEFELNYDTSLDPVTRTFSDLPSDILNEVVNYLDGEERLIAAQVSRNLRSVIRNRKPAFSMFLVDVQFECTYLYFEKDKFRLYAEANLDHDEHRFAWSAKEYYVCGETYMKAAFWAMQNFLNLPKLELEDFCIQEVFSEQLKGFGEMLEKLDNKIKAKVAKITVTHEEEELLILPYLDPNFLRKLVLTFHGYQNDYNLEQIKIRMENFKKLEQFQNLKIIKFKMRYWDLFDVENFTVFKRFSLIFDSVIEIDWLIGAIRKLLSSTSLELCNLKLLYPRWGEIEDAVQNELIRITVENDENPKIRKFLIPDNNKEYFEIEFVKTNKIRIERKQ